MRVDDYRVLSRCVDEGVEYGYNRAHKHTDAPEPNALKDTIAQAVMNAINEYFHFGPPEEDAS